MGINITWRGSFKLKLFLTSIFKPLLVCAPNASLCSSIVHSIISLISPLRYEPDYRPYFTIHDSDFNDILNSKQNWLGKFKICN